MSWYEKMNVLCCISLLDNLKLVMYLEMYNTKVVDTDIMNFAVVYGNVKILKTLHYYSSNVFDLETLKTKDIPFDNLYFLQRNYAGIYI